MRAERTTAPVLTASELEARDRHRRKLAIGRAMLASGPKTAGEIGILCAAEGVGVYCADRYVRTLTGSGYLVSLGDVPPKYALSERGSAWAQAIKAGEVV